MRCDSVSCSKREALHLEGLVDFSFIALYGHEDDCSSAISFTLCDRYFNPTGIFIQPHLINEFCGFHGA